MRHLSDLDVLLLPGWHNSGPEHWLGQWQASFPTMRRVMQADWSNAEFDVWSARLSEEVARSTRPVLVIAYSLGTSLLTRWAADHDKAPVIGAFLVAPSDREQADNHHDEVRGFAPMVLKRLPFPAMVVASSDDGRVALPRARFFAESWGAAFADAGPRDHFGPELGIWPQGLVLLGQFLGTLRDSGPAGIA